MARVAEFLVYSIIPAVVLLHLLASPYTKVEESFHIQAIHDILTYGIPFRNLSNTLRTQFDHLSFPGAVPRSFAGALVLSTMSQPFVMLLDNKIDRQLLARAVLGFFNSFALFSYALGLRRVFGKPTAYWYLLFQASQFHLIYYMSRTLSNMFAFGITTLALRYILPETLAAERARPSRLSLCLLTIAGIVFRSELALFLATHTAFLYWAGHINIRRDIIPAGAAGLLIGLTITVAIDSFFWQQFPLWPELTSFKFNVMSGQASAWGTQPWYFYFTNAIPRLLLNPLTYCIGIPFSVRQPSSRRHAIYLLVPSLAYVAVYSFQPHKEWRFIVYVIPPLTATAALGTSYIWTHRNKSLFYRFLSLAIVFSTTLSFLVSTFILLPASSTNYPGAHALDILHKRADGSKPVISVHMGNLACQTGVTRFLQLQRPHQASSADGLAVSPGGGRSLWRYDKTEDESLKSTPEFWDHFDYVLAEDELEVVSRVTDPSNWEVFDVANGFGGIKVLLPGEEGTGTVEKNILAAILGEGGARLWDRGQDLARHYVTRGWWMEMRVEPKIKILKHV